MTEEQQTEDNAANTETEPSTELRHEEEVWEQAYTGTGQRKLATLAQQILKTVVQVIPHLTECKPVKTILIVLNILKAASC